MKKIIAFILIVTAFAAALALFFLLLPRGSAQSGGTGAVSAKPSGVTSGTAATSASTAGKTEAGAAEYEKYLAFTILSDGTYAVLAKEGAELPAEVVLPSERGGKPVSEIAEGGFSGCGIERITLSENIRAIRANAFAECTSLKSVSVKTRVLRSVGRSAFSDCTALAEISFPEELLVNCFVELYAFQNCARLESITLPKGVLAAGIYAFSGCASLRAVMLPEGFGSIGMGAFSGCASLRSLKIPAEVYSVGESAFYGCDALEEVEVSGENANYAAVGGCLIDKANKSVIFGTGKSEIPADGSVERIGVSAFSHRADLESLVLPESVANVSRTAFANCENLKSAELRGVVSIGQEAFAFCKSLESLTLPKSLEKIYDYAFDNCERLTSIYYGGTVEEWNAIEKYFLRGAVTVYCTDGEVKL